MAIVVQELRPRRDPAVIGPFKLLARLGGGGFGTVYAARWLEGPEERLTLDDLVAVKVVKPDLADLPDFRSRFATEIEAIKRVDCQFVPRFVGADANDDLPWLATNLVPGLSLDKVVGTCGPLPERAVWHLAAALAEVLAAIHASQVVHRDFKPQNVLMVPTGPWVIDFSLVHLVELTHKSSSRRIMASYKYAPPEQLRGLREAGYAADVYALGATLLYAATGHPPFDGANEVQVIQRVLNERPDLSELPRGLYGLVTSCLQYAADRRPTLAQVIEEASRQTGGARDGFSQVLPPDVVTLLEECDAEITTLTGEVTPLPRVPPDDPDESGYELLAWPAGASPAATMPPGSGQQMDPAGPLDAGLAGTASAAWSVPLEDWVCAPVAVAGDVLVATCLNGAVTSLRVADGMSVARCGVDGAVHSGALLSPHGGKRGTAYVGTARGEVHAIDMASGAGRVVVEADAPIEGALVASRSRVYALSADGVVHCIDPFTGEWTILARLGRPATGSLSVTGEGKILVADVEGLVHAIDAIRGEEAWTASTDGLVLAAPVQSGERVYIGGTDGVVRELRMDGQELATDNLDVPIHATPVAADGRLYVPGADGRVRVYDTTQPEGTDMRRLREWPLGDEISGLAVFRRRLFVTAGRRLVAVDVSRGNQEELRRLNCVISAPPVIVTGNCFIVGLGGIAECLRVA